MTLNYLSNSIGEKIAVVIPIDEFMQLIEFIEQFEDIQEYKTAKEANLGTLSFDAAFREIQRK